MEDKIHLETRPDGTVVEHHDDHEDAKTGAKIGGVGGAVVGGVAGSALGPGGTVVGAVVGGLAGAAASGAAVDAVDKHDDDATVSGVRNDRLDHAKDKIADKANEFRERVDRAMDTNNTPGIQTGGHAVDGTPDTRGITEKIADALTGDKIDDKTGKRIDD
ncbi:MAG: hypothetical protein KF812_00540 [Fimbriimonadaceae bacterium]|nr:hypothetical protein [Fimbriimonadaceae bacterium]